MTHSRGPTFPKLKWVAAVGCYRAIGVRGAYSLLKNGSLWNCIYYCDSDCEGHRVWPGFYSSQYKLRELIERFDAGTGENELRFIQ